MLELTLMLFTILQFHKDRQALLDQLDLRDQHLVHLSELLLLVSLVVLHQYQTLALSLLMFLISQFLKGQLDQQVQLVRLVQLALQDRKVSKVFVVSRDIQDLKVKLDLQVLQVTLGLLVLKDLQGQKADQLGQLVQLGLLAQQVRLLT